MSTEFEAVRSLALSLDAFKAYCAKPVSALCVIRLDDAERLTKDLATSPGAMMTRRLLQHLSFDESLPFTWRLDHKLIQMLMLSRYIPGMVPNTTGLGFAESHSGNLPLRKALIGMWDTGFVVKRTRGYNSAREDVLSSARSIPEAGGVTSHLTKLYNGSPESEQFLVQEKINSISEFRVHTLGRRVIPSLTFCTYDEGGAMLGPAQKAEVEDTVSHAVNQLPDGMCAQSLCGWDLGMDAQGRYYVFEINYSGLFPACREHSQCDGSPCDPELSLQRNHPLCSPGFHCSGFVQNERNAALLLEFIAEQCEIGFQFDTSAAGTANVSKAWQAQMRGTERWRKFNAIITDIHELWCDSAKPGALGQLSLRDSVYLNQAGWTERLFVERVDWLDKMIEDLR